MQDLIAISGLESFLGETKFLPLSCPDSLTHIYKCPLCSNLATY